MNYLTILVNVEVVHDEMTLHLIYLENFNMNFKYINYKTMYMF